MSQTALATRTRLGDEAGKGVARTVLVGYENGNFRPGAREIRLICEVLGITPTWLILGTEEASSTQVSMEAIRGRSWRNAVRLAMAISMLKPHERAAFQSLVLSLAGRQLGDLKLSALLTVGGMIATHSYPELKEWFGEEADSKDVTLDQIVLRCAEGFTTNVGNTLRFDEEGEILGGEWLYPDPSAKVSE